MSVKCEAHNILPARVPMKHYTRHLPSLHPTIQADEDVVLDESASSVHPSAVLDSFHVRSVLRSLQDLRVSPVRLEQSGVHGRVLCTTERLRRGDRIGEYEGDRVVKKAADQCEAEYRRHGVDCYLISFSGDVASSDSSGPDALGGSFLIDGTVNGNLTRFSNQSCSRNT